MCDAHSNFAYSTVAVAPSPPASGTSLTLQTGDGAKMPAAPFNLVVWPTGAQPLTSNAEVVRVTNVTGDVLTITRTQEGSSARTIGVGDQVMAAITTKTLTDIESPGYFAVGNTTQSSSGSLTAGALSIRGAGAISVGVSNGSVVLSAAAGAQSNQTLGLYGIGNTTQNSSTTLDARTLSFDGLGIVTVGFSNGSIQVSATQSAQSVGLYGVGNTTQNSSTTLDARTLSFDGLGIVSVGFSNGSVQVSASQSAQSVGLYGLGNTTQNSSTTLDARSISFNGLGIVTVGYSNGSVQISASSPQTVQTVGMYGVGNTTQNSSTTLDARTISFRGNQDISVGYSNGSVQLSVNVTGAQSNQSVGLYGVGNTTQNSSTTLDARTLSFDGLGGISVGFSNGSIQLSASPTSSLAVGGALSLSTAGNTITVSLPVGNVYATSNTFGTSSGTFDQRTLSIQGSGEVSVAASNGGFIVSAPVQTNQSIGLYAVGNTTQNSSTTLDARTLSFDGLGAASVGFSNGSIQISVAAGAQSNQTVGLYGVGNTTQNSSTTLDARTISYNGLGIVTVGFSNGSVDISATQSAQTVGLYGLGNTTQNSSTTLDARSISFNGLGIITVGYSNGSVQISAIDAAQTNQSIGLYAVGNTTQNSSTTLDARTLSFRGNQDITVGYSNGSVQLSVNVTGAQSNQTIGFYGVGNTTQNSSTTLDARTVSFDALGAMTVGYSNGSIQLSAPATSSIVGASGISVSTNGSTISVYNNTLMSYYPNMMPFANSQTMSVQGSTQYVFPFEVGDFVSASYVRFLMSASAQSTSFGTTGTTGFSGSLLSTINAVLYSLGTGASSLSLQSVASGSVGYSQQWSVTATGNGSQYTISYKITYPLTGGTSSFSTSTNFSNGSIQMSSGLLSNFTGLNYLDIPFANSISPGAYWMAIGVSSTASTQATNAITGLQITGSTLAASQPNNAVAILGAGTNSSVGFQVGLGSWTTNAIGTTASIGLANISSSASQPIPYAQFIRQA